MSSALNAAPSRYFNECVDYAEKSMDMQAVHVTWSKGEHDGGGRTGQAFSKVRSSLSVYTSTDPQSVQVSLLP